MKHQALGEHLTDLELRYTVECQCVPLRYVLVCVTRVELQYVRATSTARVATSRATLDLL